MKEKKHSLLFKLFYYGVVSGLVFGIIGSIAFAFWFSSLEIPDFGAFGNRKVVESTKIYDRTGEILLWDVHENIKRTVVPFDEISRHLKNATIAIEDDTFYQHHGFDPMAIMRAFIANLKTGRAGQGGSTITQQLVKYAFLTREKSYSRKIKELVLSLKLEQVFEKDQILEFYLNEIPYGGSNYGAEAACQSLYDKSANEITLAEAAYLAAIANAPTFYSPYGNNIEELETRKNLVLSRMTALGFITQKEEDQAKEEKVKFVSKGDQTIKAPHFTMFTVMNLEEKYGRDVVEQGGLKVITTLDYELQQKAEELVTKHSKINLEKYNASNAAVVVVDSKTGQILTMVGSKDYFDVENGGNFNVAVARRQPGSSIKPFIYATAFKKGYTPDTVLFDLVTEFNSSCNPDMTPKLEWGVKEEDCYHPQNYDGKFKGPIKLKDALAQSRNIPAVKLLYLAGLQDSAETIQNMGITTLGDINRYGLTLVLGGGEVSLLDMTGAYSVFANEGNRNPNTGILKIEDNNGKVLEEYRNDAQMVLDRNIALSISDILSDNNARSPAFGANSWLHIPGKDVAAKTGTTNSSRDAWVLGYTPNLAVGVWVGNNDNSIMAQKSSSEIAAPLWNEFIKSSFTLYPAEDKFPEPDLDYPEDLKPVLRGEWRGGLTYNVDKVSTKLATELTPLEMTEEKVLQQIHNILYWVDKNDPQGSIPSDPTQDSQFELWEKPVRDWVNEQNLQEQIITDLPTETDDVHRPENYPKITIDFPQLNALYNPRNIMNVKISYESKYGLGQVDYFLDDTFLGSVTQKPFDFAFIPLSSMEFEKKTAKLKIIAYDNVRNKMTVVMPLNFSSEI